MKEKAIEVIKEDLGQVDMVVYSVAAPRRTDHDGVTHQSVLKPVGSSYTNKSINLTTNLLEEVTIEPASPEEIEGTIKVMGGEDWRLWIEALGDAGVLTDDVTTVAYSYVGPGLTHAIYRAGAIGRAKEDLEKTARDMDGILSQKGGHAYVAINKALVTQASSAIPVIPLYITILKKLLEEKGQEEGCIEQIQRLFKEKLFIDEAIVDEAGRLRVDDYEMAEDIQSKIDSIWNNINDDNLNEYVDMKLYWDDFYKLFGFGLDGVDYEAETSSLVDIEDSIVL
jgi:enoyl-[acyl-carrier protein] reductase/trans-2-enoyl-CoA reductase (NAD+)